MDIMSLDYLAQEIGGPIPPIQGIGGIPVEPVGFVLMNVKVPCVQGCFLYLRMRGVLYLVSPPKPISKF